MCKNNQQNKEPVVEKEPEVVRERPCIFCGSVKPLWTYEQMYGPGAVGYDCCPDCGGV